MSDDRTTALPADWDQILDRIRQQIDQALGGIVEPPELPPIESSWQVLSQDVSQRLRQRLDQIDARAAAARDNARQLEALLAFEAEALQAWLTQAAAVRQQLAQATARSIS